MTSIKKELSRVAGESGMGFLSRMADSDKFGFAARVFVPGERPIHVFSSSRGGLRILTDRRLLCVGVGPKKTPDLRSFWYAGIANVRANRQFANNGIAILYEGEEHVVWLGKKDIDQAVAKISELLPADAGRIEFTSAERVMDFMFSELDRDRARHYARALLTLPHRIDWNEELLAACDGQYRGGAALALLTRARLIICDGVDDPERDVEVPSDQLLGAETSEGIWRGRIGIRVKGDRYDFSFSNKGDTTRMAKAIKRLVRDWNYTRRYMQRHAQR